MNKNANSADVRHLTRWTWKAWKSLVAMVNIVDHSTIVHISNLLILVTLKDRRSLPQFDLYRGRHKSHNKVAQWVQILSEGVLKSFNAQFKVIHPKYSKHWPYIVAHTIEFVCSKMLNHGLFLSLFKLIPCPIYRIVYIYVSIFKFHIGIFKRFLDGI
jgi:hypothetical protein